MSDRILSRQRRWRAGLAAVLALALLTSGAIPALGVGVWPEILVRPDRNPLKLCVGQKLELLVQVKAFLAGPEVGWLKVTTPLPVQPVAKSSDTRVATLTRKQPITENYGVAEPYQGERYDLAGIKAGTAKITFDVTIPKGWAGDRNDTLNPFYKAPVKVLKASKTVEVKVEKCNYVVGAVHIMSVPGGGLMTAVAEGVSVSADESGQLSGTGNLEWVVAAAPVPECPNLVSFVTESSEVDVAGEIDDDGNLTLRLDHGGVVWDWHTGECSGNHLTTDLEAPIQLPPTSLAMSAEGGSIQMSQSFYIGGIEVPEFEIKDTEILTVVPITESDAVSLAQ